MTLIVTSLIGITPIRLFGSYSSSLHTYFQPSPSGNMTRIFHLTYQSKKSLFIICMDVGKYRNTNEKVGKGNHHLTIEVKVGMEFTLSPRLKNSYFSAESLEIVQADEKTVKFILKEGKGRGSMPVQHLNYMIKKKDLVEKQASSQRRRLLEAELAEGEEQIS